MTPDEELQILVTFYNRMMLTISAMSNEGLEKAEEYFWKEFLRDDRTAHEDRLAQEFYHFLERVRKTR